MKKNHEKGPQESLCWDQFLNEVCWVWPSRSQACLTSHTQWWGLGVVLFRDRVEPKTAYVQLPRAPPHSTPPLLGPGTSCIQRLPLDTPGPAHFRPLHRQQWPLPPEDTPWHAHFRPRRAAISASARPKGLRSHGCSSPPLFLTAVVLHPLPGTDWSFSKIGIPNFWDLVPDDLKWNWYYNNNRKCTINMCVYLCV